MSLLQNSPRAQNIIFEHKVRPLMAQVGYVSQSSLPLAFKALNGNPGQSKENTILLKNINLTEKLGEFEDIGDLDKVIY